MTDFILEEVARLFGFPCDNENIKSYIHNNALDWCEKYCNKCSAKECWEKYFQIKKENNNGNN